MKKSNKGDIANDIYLEDELLGLPAKEFAKIKKKLKQTAKKVHKKKHIYFNEEWNGKN